MRRVDLAWIVGAAVTATIFALAVWLLHRELGQEDWRAILVAARATPSRQLAVALVCTVASYSVLTLYDTLALRHVGRELGYGRIAITSFTSYVTSHNLGLSGIGGTALRYRLYTAWGLSAAEIAEIVAFCALTFWIGFSFLGGVVFTCVPVELPESLQAVVRTTRPLGLVLLGLTAASLAWSFWLREPLRLRGWTFEPPSRREFLVQLPLAVLDWTLAAAVLFALLPAGHGLGFAQVFSVFLTAQAAGMISHVPAGLGVFETVVIYLLPSDIATPDLAAALLAYRALYYLLPLAFGALLFLGVEAFLRRTQLAALQRWATPLGEVVVPRALGFTTALAGAVLLLTGSLPGTGQRMSWIRDVVPLPVLELSHFLASLVGMGLLILARGLQRRIDAAWWLSGVLLVLGIALALARGLDYEEAGLLTLMLAALLPFRSAFTRRASLLHLRLSPRWLVDVAMVAVAALWLGLLAFRHVEYRHDLWWQFAYEGDAPRFLRASAGVLALIGFLGVARLLEAVPPPLPAPSAEDLTRVHAILAAEPETPGNLARLGDKHLLFDEARSSFVQFAVRNRSWIAMGDPVGGSVETKRELVWRFRETAESAGGRAVFYQVAQENLGWYAEAGFTLLKIGEEARVDLAGFNLQGGAHKHLRSSVHRLVREGLSFEVLPGEGVRAELDALRAISDAWLATKETREKGFSLGFFANEYITAGPVAVVRRGGRLLAFANLWLGAPGGELSVDLMRHLPDAPGGLMDFLFAQLFEWGREHGFRWFSLGMAPLSGLESRASAPVWNRIAALVFRHGEHFYNFQGLRQYKDKFAPVWRARYVAVPGGLPLPGILVDISALISGGLAGILRR